MPMTQEEMVQKITELEGQVKAADDALNAAILAKDLAELSQEDAEAYEGLSETEKAEFAKGDQEGRDALLMASAERIKKTNQMSDDVQKKFDDIQKQLADANTKLAAAETVAKQAQESQHLAELAKQAEKEFPNLPGTAEEKAKVLKGLEALPETERNAVLATMRSANEALGKQMEPLGKTAAAPAGDAWQQIETLAKSLVEKGGTELTMDAAIARVLETNPKLYTQYLEASGRRQ